MFWILHLMCTLMEDIYILQNFFGSLDQKKNGISFYQKRVHRFCNETLGRVHFWAEWASAPRRWLRFPFSEVYMLSEVYILWSFFGLLGRAAGAAKNGFTITERVFPTFSKQNQSQNKLKIWNSASPWPSISAHFLSDYNFNTSSRLIPRFPNQKYFSLRRSLCTFIFGEIEKRQIFNSTEKVQAHGV